MTNSLPNTDRLLLLETFVRIVEAGSLSAAARQLSTTQPTISRRLQALEQLLGVPLLRRSTHQLALTQAGERCLSQARTLLQTWVTLESDLRGTHDHPRGRLRVLVPHAFGQAQLLAPLQAYLTDYPEVSVEWSLQDKHWDLHADGYDCAIQIGAVQEPSAVALLLAELPRSLVAAPDLLARHADPLALDTLPQLPWVALNLFYQDDITLVHARDGHAWRFPIQPRLSTDSLHVLHQAVLAGLGAGIASTWLVADDIAQGRLQVLAPDWRAPTLPISLVYPYAPSYPARLRRFVELMRVAMPGMAGMAAPGSTAAAQPVASPPRSS